MSGGNDLRVWTLSLGCPKNRVDTERLLGSLGCGIVSSAHIGRSHLVLINTCAFIEPAARESIRAILDVAAKIKNLKNRPLLAVAGCMVGRYGASELAKELPEVDLWLPTREMGQWPEMIRQALHLHGEAHSGRFLSTPPSYAWLKIGEGCRHSCSFCAIPAIRGRLRSQNCENILSEAAWLAEKGVREIVLVAQDVTAWGKDFRGDVSAIKTLPQLLDKLAATPGLAWLRMLYLYPDSITDELLQTMARLGPPVLPYFDIPLQHCEEEILVKMGRPFAGGPAKILERIRKILPEAAIRTTLITGFPGETERQFKNMLEFVEESRFEHLGVFTFRPEEGTKAAGMPDQIPEDVKEERRRELMELQSEISRENLEKYVGRQMDVLVDKPQGEWPGLYFGRVWFQAPEIDGVTYVSGPGVASGAMLECDITGSHTYDLDALAPVLPCGKSG